LAPDAYDSVALKLEVLLREVNEAAGLLGILRGHDNQGLKFRHHQGSLTEGKGSVKVDLVVPARFHNGF
jgi:hypothetical protein